MLLGRNAERVQPNRSRFLILLEPKLLISREHFDVSSVLRSEVQKTFTAAVLNARVCVRVGCWCVLERSAAALLGAGLVLGRLLADHPPGPVVQQSGYSALRGPLGSDPPSDVGPF